MKLLWKPGAVVTLDIEGKLLAALVDEKHHNPSANFPPGSNMGKRLLGSEVGDAFSVKIKDTGKYVTAIVIAIAGESVTKPVPGKPFANAPKGVTAKPLADKSVQPGTIYINHCWKCGASINSQKNQRCPKCNLFKCRKCGHCMCNSGIS